MFSSRASEESDLTPSVALSSPVTTFAPSSESNPQAHVLDSTILSRDARWLVGAALLYALLVVITTLTLHPYFSQTWDAITFVNAGKIALSPAWVNLYAQSRADSYWPYAYPPLHAFLVAPLLALAGPAPAWLLVRIPPLLFDIATGVLLYFVIARKTQQQNLARLGMLVWLLNPVTWYDTAVQGHFEAEWLFFILLGYVLAERKRGWVLPTLSFAVALLLKQTAILFVLPFWAQLFFAERTVPITRRALTVIASMVLFALPVLLISLPFLVYSNDYWYMNVPYVANVPLQTQSWLVAVAALVSPDNVLLSASSLLTLIAAGLISLWAAWRGLSLWFAATLIVLAFFLLSKKVVGYYYVMLLPFAVVTLIPAARFRLLALLVAATTFISLSPYFASWANQSHVWIYAALGIANSVLWLALFVWLVRNRAAVNETTPQNVGVETGLGARGLAFLSVALFLAAAAAALLQPLINSSGSPIRAPLVAPVLETPALFALLGFALLVFIAIFASARLSQTIARVPPLSGGLIALVVLLAPLFFLTFTLTKESTAAFELVLKLFGV